MTPELIRAAIVALEHEIVRENAAAIRERANLARRGDVSRRQLRARLSAARIAEFSQHIATLQTELERCQTRKD